MAGIKVSDVIYQKALKATIDAVKRGVDGDRAINAGINVIRGSTWFQHQDATQQKEVESSFRKTMRTEFGMAVPDEPKDHNPTEVIDYQKPVEKIAPIVPPVTVTKPRKTEQAKIESKETSFAKTPVRSREDPAKKEVIRPIKETRNNTPPPPAPAEVPKKRRGMSLGTFIGCLVFLGFLAYMSWVLYNHEVSIENIVVYENEKLTFKETFPAETIQILGQEIEMNYAISRKTSPLKVFRPVDRFPYWERVQDIECNACDYWTNVENYDLHHYPDK